MITDDTLREGMQAPGIAFSPKEKVDLAEAIHKCGIERMLFSYPSAHSSEEESIRLLQNKKIFKELYGLGRAIREDIDKIYSTGAMISLHFPFQYKSLDQVYEDIAYAVSLGQMVEVSVIDITQYSIESLVKIVNKLSEIGVQTIQLPDTMGKATPELIRRVVSAAKRQKNSEIGVHCHNDRGTSIANAIAGVDAGADHVDATFLGIGERNGITDMISISSYMNERGMETELNMKEMVKFSRNLFDIIVKKAGIEFFAKNIPNIGENIGVHTAGTHAAFGDVFHGSNYSVNVYTGRSMLEKILNQSGIVLDKEKMKKLMKLVKDRSAEEGRVILANEIVMEAKGFVQGN